MFQALAGGLLFVLVGVPFAERVEAQRPTEPPPGPEAADSFSGDGGGPAVEDAPWTIPPGSGRDGTGEMAVPATASRPPPRGDAGDLPKLAWDPGWTPIEPWEIGVAFGFFAATAVVEETIEPNAPRVDRAWLFDPWVRDGLVLPTRRAREAADVTSDYTLLATLGAPLLLDDLLLVALLDGQPSLALKLAVLDLEAIAFAVFLGTTTQHLVQRARPFRRECVDDPQYSEDCGGRGSVLSFFSIHTTMAFTGAGLLCLHHTELPLFGGGPADAATCGVGLGVATLTGALRIMADRHWSTDVLAGAAVGLASGWLLPWLLHFRPGGGGDSLGEDGLGVLPMVDPVAGHYGLQVTRAW